VIPTGWKKKRLMDVTRKPIGYGIVQTGPHISDGIPCLRVVDITKPAIIVSDMVKTSEEIHDSYRRTVLQKNDIVLALRGEIGLCRIVPEELIGTNITRGLALLSANTDMVLPFFLSQVLRSTSVRTDLMLRVNGSALKEIPIGELKKVQIPVPPLAEQKTIAEILGNWDEAIEKIEKLIEAKKKLKKGLMQQLLTGKKRFKEFSGHEWKTYGFKEIFNTVPSKKFQIQKSQYLARGTYPVIDQGRKHVVAYTNNGSVFDRVPVIVFGDHTRIVKWVDFPFVVGADGTQLIKTKPLCDIQFGYYLLSCLTVPDYGYSRHFKLVKESVFKVPQSNNDQRRIASVLTTVDAEISLLEKMLDLVKWQKDGLMQKLLTGRIRVRA